MTHEQKTKMNAAIEKHGENLLKIFPNAKIKDPIKLCKALRRLELKAHKAAENWCNGIPGPKAPAAEHDSDWWGDEGERLVEKAVKILGNAGRGNEDIGIVFNGDARGYALKISAVEHEFCGLPDTVECRDIYKDWGGYGIVAPDFTPAPEDK